MKFYASVRLDIRRIGAVKDGDKIAGNRVRVRVVKNKIAPPFKDAEFEIIYGHGVSVAGELIDLAIERKLITRSGSWYALQDERMGQGRERARAWLDARPELKKRLRAAVLADESAPVDLGPPESWAPPPELAAELSAEASVKDEAA